MKSDLNTLSKLSRTRVLVVGDVMLDRYWFGQVERVSPEAPVPIVCVSDMQERIGGAGNVSCNITALDAYSSLLSIVGSDEAGKRVAEMTEQSGVSSSLLIDEKVNTTIKLRVVSKNQQLLRVDFETKPGYHSLNQMMCVFKKLLDSHDVVVFSDYGKGVLQHIEHLIQQGTLVNKPILVDPKGDNLFRYRGATMIKPNLKEFEAAVGSVIDQSDVSDMSNKAYQLMEHLKVKKLLITLSENGMILFSRNQDPIYKSSNTQEVYDVSGAGDTVIAVMGMALAAGLDDSDAIEIANGAAGVVISKFGTATASMEELNVMLRKN